MKRRTMLVVGSVVVLGLVWVSFGQSERAVSGRSERAAGERSRRGMWRERQQKAISAIEEQLVKIKSGMESSSRRPQNWRDLSEEERNKLREQFRKLRQERILSVAIIEEQIARLKGRRSLQQEHEKSISELSSILELAKKEKATQTTAAIEKLIAGRKKEFEKRMEKLGLPQRTRSRGN